MISTQITPSKYSLVTSDSREVKPGALFVAVQGGTRDGHDFIDEVIAQGAVAIIGERDLGRTLSVPYIRVADSRLALAQEAAQFYGNPSHSMKIAGVTGTSGKTTVTFVLESILLADKNNKVGVIGTVNFRYTVSGGTTVLPSTHTTPGAVELQKLLARMKSEGVTHVVMEVSSHALAQKRVAGIEFDSTAFTNLTPEHQDFHKDMEDYYSAKKILFTDLFEAASAAGKAPARAINIDDPYGQRLAQELGSSANTFSVSGAATWSGATVRESLEGIEGMIGQLHIRSSLIGRFNVANILTAIGLAKGLGVSDEVVARGIQNLAGVPGRLERVPNSRGIHVFVDYAHKSDALKTVLMNLQSFRGSHRLITVMGCGGDRDRTKRPVMGQIAEAFSDAVIVTSDNPRTENPDTIIAQIVGGMAENKHSIQPDRRRAIFEAVALAHPGDLILIAGKGHEDYQIIGTQKHPFDDRKTALEALA
jgi:UDP-N-acetylmuramoyl-L-alanyl-D-glutamate--2,6-diaminopimelate ligase